MSEKKEKFIDCLFDPFNPEKTIGLPQDKTITFAPLRLSTDPSVLSKKGPISHSWYDRWEQMICQLQNKASLLFKLNPKLNFVTNCNSIPVSKSKSTSGGAPAPGSKEKTKSIWKSNSFMVGDLIVLSELDDVIYTDPLTSGLNISKGDSDMIMLQYYELPEDDPKTLDLQYVDKITTGPHLNDQNKTSVGYISKSGILNKIKKPLGDKINIIKIVTTGHYTLALHYEKQNRIEYFDPSGSSWSMTRPSSKKITNDNIDKMNVANILNKILEVAPGNFTSINTKNLQILDEDIYCQTWVLLYVYMRHVYPKIKDEDCNEFFLSMTKDKKGYEKLFVLILHWWDYLIYLDETIWPDDFEAQYNSLFPKVGGRRKSQRKRKKKIRTKKK